MPSEFIINATGVAALAINLRGLAGVNYPDRPATTILAGWKRGMISL